MICFLAYARELTRFENKSKNSGQAAGTQSLDSARPRVLEMVGRQLAALQSVTPALKDCMTGDRRPQTAERMAYEQGNIPSGHGDPPSFQGCSSENEHYLSHAIE
jgi:hypothetical protein